MRELWLYNVMDRMGIRNYRAKIMLMAFVGTHIPLIALVSYFALKSSADWSAFVATVGVTLLATLVGTGITLVVLNHLLRPVLMTSRTLRGYRKNRDTGALPTVFGDEVGTLMADATHTLTHLERALNVLEFLDASTGLPNRRRLAADLEQRFAAGRPLAVCAVRFGSYSRLAGTLDSGTAEAATGEITARLKACAGDRAALYRVASADFVLLVAGDDSEGVAARGDGTWLGGVIGACQSNLAVRGLSIDPVLRGGVALWPEDGATPEALIDNALSAVAAPTGDLRVSFHSPKARQTAVARLQLEQEIRRALTTDEFVLHFQPVVDLSLGRAIGAEALIRWQHPERGLVPPGQFIGVAEQTGLIDPIGLWVMRNACMQVKDWNACGLPGMKVAVNLSARQFLDPDLIAHVDEALRTSGIAADQLEIELTETAAMADQAFTRTVFGKLRDLGVSIAIDDFGTGYASMSYLRKLPFDKLKIDREFVMNVHSARDSQAICGALVTLAKGLGLRILAEGTETAEEVRYLWSRGCDLYQGFYFSKPLAAAQFANGLQAVSASSLAVAAGEMRGAPEGMRRAG